jgi:FKBP-type peptidyl-prolyl cis-trans isomerase
MCRDATNFPAEGNTVRIHYETFVRAVAAPPCPSTPPNALPTYHPFPSTRCAQLAAADIKIDSSRDRKTPLEFRLGLGQVIPGVEIAVKRMSRGQKVRVLIPPTLAYGPRGYPPIIPPKSSLLFEIELISFA